MTVIRPNSITGITSITAQANEINVFRSNGLIAGLNLNGVNFNTTAGISTLAALKITGNLDVAGVLTYQDVTNVDSLGIGTFRVGVNVPAGQLDVGSNIKLGNAGVITATSFVGSGAQLTGITQTTINNNTNNYVVTATGTANTLNGEANLTFDGTNLDLGDDKKIRLGDGQDFEIYHDGTTNRFQSSGLKNFQFNPKDTDVGLKIIGDGAVELYHDGGLFAETYGSGFKISNGGELFIDGNAASGHCQIIMTRSDRSWAINNETNFRIYSVSGNNSAPTSGWSQFLEINHQGDLLPGSNASQDLGSSSTRWDNLYVNDLQLSNKGSQNSVDGTWGDWTLQEGENDLYMLNNRSGKKFRIKMEEVS